MSELLKYRQQKNLTQEELSERSGVSVRTIQRIEGGVQPKGFSLRALANALGIPESSLLAPAAPPARDPLAKFINLSSLPFVFLPPLNIMVPLIIMYRRKAISPLAKDIISLQILWAIIAIPVFILSAFFNRIFSADFPFVIVAAVLLAGADAYIILRNTIAIDKKQALGIRLNFSFL